MDLIELLFHSAYPTRGRWGTAVAWFGILACVVVFSGTILALFVAVIWAAIGPGGMPEGLGGTIFFGGLILIVATYALSLVVAWIARAGELLLSRRPSKD
jgi:hypothetical protein